MQAFLQKSGDECAETTDQIQLEISATERLTGKRSREIGGYAMRARDEGGDFLSYVVGIGQV